MNKMDFFSKRDQVPYETPTMWYVPPAKAQTSLHIRAVWSEPLLGT